MLNKIGELLGGSLGETISKVVGTFKLAPEKKAEIELALEENKHELQLWEYKLAERAEATIATEIEAKKEIIVAELNQDDLFTKRARPLIIYTGLFAVIMNYVIAPLAASLLGATLPELALPGEFWATWGGVCGLYVWGRSKEKQGITTKMTRLITGNKLLP